MFKGILTSGRKRRTEDVGRLQPCEPGLAGRTAMKFQLTKKSITTIFTLVNSLL